MKTVAVVPYTRSGTDGHSLLGSRSYQQRAVGSILDTDAGNCQRHLQLVSSGWSQWSEIGGTKYCS